jgi:hypothetical protein
MFSREFELARIGERITRRPETRPSCVGVDLVATDSPRFEAVRQVTAFAWVGIEADYVPDEFTRT